MLLLIKDKHVFVKIKLIHSHLKNKLVYKTKMKQNQQSFCRLNFF